MSLDAATDDLRATFKLAMRRFPAAVTVITSADQTRRAGALADGVETRHRRPVVAQLLDQLPLLGRDADDVQVT